MYKLHRYRIYPTHKQKILLNKTFGCTRLVYNLALQTKILAYQQRKYAKYKGKKTLHKIRLLNEKIANQRKDYTQKLSSKLISENQTIIIEDLTIKNLSKRCKPKQDEDGKYLPNGQVAKSGLNRSIQDAGWGMFVDMLTYKANWYGVNLIKISQWEPSSKKCSNCKVINKDLTLDQRKWTCKHCGSVHDRDINAAINIKQIGLRDHIKNIRSEGLKTKNRGKLPAIAGVTIHEVQNKPVRVLTV